MLERQGAEDAGKSVHLGLLAGIWREVLSSGGAMAEDDVEHREQVRLVNEPCREALEGAKIKPFFSLS